MGLLCHGHGAVGFNPPQFLPVAISVPAFSPSRWDLLSPVFWDRPNHTKLPQELSELRCLLLVQGHRPVVPSGPCWGCASTRGRLFLPHPPPGEMENVRAVPSRCKASFPLQGTWGWGQKRHTGHGQRQGLPQQRGGRDAGSAPTLGIHPHSQARL